MKKVTILLIVFVLSLGMSYAESLYDRYSYATTDSITLEDGIKISFDIDPNTALNQINTKNCDYDLFVFPLPETGLNALLNSGCLLDLSSNQHLNAFYQTMPPALQDALARDNQFLAFPLHLEMHPSILLTTTDKLSTHNLSFDTLPDTVIELLEVANEWYHSGKLDGVNLIHHYEAPEMIVYWTMQQYALSITAHGASPDYSLPFFKRLLEQALQLSDTMTQHGAFSSNAESLFTISTMHSSSEHSSSCVSLPLTLSDFHPSHDYLVGLVAIPNPYSTRKEAVLNYLAGEINTLSASTLELLNTASFPRTLSVLNEEIDRLATDDSLYQVASLLANRVITIESCINMLQN